MEMHAVSNGSVENSGVDVRQLDLWAENPNNTTPSSHSAAIAVVTRQPSSKDSQTSEIIWRPWLNNHKDSSEDGEQCLDDYFKRPTGLAPLAASDLISVASKPPSSRCDWDVPYVITDGSAEEPAIMFTALEELQCCSGGSLQNIVIRDPVQQPVARVCYKENSLIFGKLLMAVYAPPDLLLGTGEESSHYGCIYSHPVFQMRNSEGDPLFKIEFNRQLFLDTGNFSIETSEGDGHLAEIQSKTKKEIRLKFNSKVSITSKVILLGFCISILHRCYKQPEQSSMTTPEM